MVALGYFGTIFDLDSGLAWLAVVLRCDPLLNLALSKGHSDSGTHCDLQALAVCGHPNSYEPYLEQRWWRDA